jgi:hypothetical protein
LGNIRTSAYILEIYSTNSTNIGVGFLKLDGVYACEDCVRHKIIFYNSYSSNLPMFSISTGIFEVNNLTFQYDASTVDTFISLTGVGAVKLEKVDIISNTPTSPTVSNKPFIIVGGKGNVTFKDVDIKYLKSNVNFIVLNDIFEFFLEINVNDITLSGDSALIYYDYGGEMPYGNISIENSNFTTVISSNVNGRVMNINGYIEYIHIYKCEFKTLSDAGYGGGLHIENCDSVVIECSKFNGLKSSGNGGAIYFGANVKFSLNNNEFEDCSAKYGGAIYTLSEFDRVIDQVSFKSNKVSPGGNGYDIFDNSTNGKSKFKRETVRCSTSSSADGSSEFSSFFIFKYNYRYDCLLVGEGCERCSIDTEAEVDANGVDFEFCGDALAPCRTLNMGYDKLKVQGAVMLTITAGAGEYTNTFITFEGGSWTVKSGGSTSPAISNVVPGVCL